MKTFKDLKFTKLPDGIGISGWGEFDNGYAISIVRSYETYSDENTWEVAVFKRYTKEDGSYGYNLCTDTPITDDVIGWQTDECVTDIMEQIQNLPNA